MRRGRTLVTISGLSVTKNSGADGYVQPGTHAVLLA